MPKCMFCNVNLLLLGSSSTLDILIHHEYEKCSFFYKEMSYKPTIFRSTGSNDYIKTEYFFYDDFCFYFYYNEYEIKLIVENNYENKIFETSFLRNSFNFSLAKNALDKIIENLLFV